jgi:hypothetical protein
MQVIGLERHSYCQLPGDMWYVSVLPLLVKVSERSLPLQVYEPCSGDDVTGLVTPPTVMVALAVTVETGKLPESHGTNNADVGI